MAFNQQQDGLENDPSERKAPASSVQSVDESRRRFTRSGVASGVLMTLASPSVMATATTSKSPSGFVSGNKSSHGPEPTSYGRSPGYWKNHTNNWPIPTATKFKSIFNCSNSSVYAKYTLLQLVTPQKDDKFKLGMHLVAAFLNARMGWTPFLTEARILSMFSQWQATGYFSPSPSVHWNAEQIVAYLTATQD